MPAVTAGGGAPPFVPMVIEDAAAEREVTIEAGGVVVRLPGDSAVVRIVGVAAGLGPGLVMRPDPSVRIVVATRPVDFRPRPRRA